MFLVAISLSIDAFGIGISYGTRKIKILPISIIIISIISFLFSSCSIFFGNFLVKILPEGFSKVLGIGILFLMGVWIVYQDISKKNQKVIEDYSAIDITMNIIKSPEFSDLDKSNSIDAKEALYLSLALSLDCLSGGIAIATMDVNLYLFPVFIVISQLAFLFLGYILGKEIKFKKVAFQGVFSGSILMFVAFIRLFL